jgi:hypothetical protein
MKSSKMAMCHIYFAVAAAVAFVDVVVAAAFVATKLTFLAELFGPMFVSLELVGVLFEGAFAFHRGDKNFEAVVVHIDRGNDLFLAHILQCASVVHDLNIVTAKSIDLQ